MRLSGLISRPAASPSRKLKADRLPSDSLLWNFTVPGQAAAQLSDEHEKWLPDIPWLLPAPLRNRIVHGYWSVDMEILHNTATEQWQRQPPT